MFDAPYNKGAFDTSRCEVGWHAPAGGPNPPGAAAEAGHRQGQREVSVYEYGDAYHNANASNGAMSRYLKTIYRSKMSKSQLQFLC